MRLPYPTLWVACFDPRLGAVVVATHSSQMQVGQVIPFEVLGIKIPDIRSKKAPVEPGSAGKHGSALGSALLVVGPPDSGKSVLSHQLFNELVKDYPNTYLQRAQWDGEGNWILELPKTATDEIREAFKQANKGQLTEGFFPYQGEAILNLRRQKELVIVDVGGKVQPEKQSVLEACTHYLIISAKPEEIEPWHDFCRQGGLAPVAVVHSVLEEKVEIVQREPFLEMVSGPWIMGQTKGVPAVLKTEVRQKCL